MAINTKQLKRRTSAEENAAEAYGCMPMETIVQRHSKRMTVTAGDLSSFQSSLEMAAASEVEPTLATHEMAGVVEMMEEAVAKPKGNEIGRVERAGFDLQSERQATEAVAKSKGRAIARRSTNDMNAAEAYGCMPTSFASTTKKRNTEPKQQEDLGHVVELMEEKEARKEKEVMEEKQAQKEKVERKPVKFQHTNSMDMKAAEAYGCSPTPATNTTRKSETRKSIAAQPSIQRRASLELRALEAFGIEQTAAPLQASRKSKVLDDDPDSDDDDSGLFMLGSAALGLLPDEGLDQARWYCSLILSHSKDDVRRALQEILGKAVTMKKRVDDMNGLMATHRPNSGLFFEIVNRAPIFSFAVPRISVRASVRADQSEEFISVFSLEAFVGFLAEARDAAFWTSSSMMASDGWRAWLTNTSCKRKEGKTGAVPWQQLAERQHVLEDEIHILFKRLRECLASLKIDWQPQLLNARAKEDPEDLCPLTKSRDSGLLLERMRTKAQLRKRVKELMSERQATTKRVATKLQETRRLEIELMKIQASQLAYQEGSSLFGNPFSDPQTERLDEHSKEARVQSQTLHRRLERCLALSQKNQMLKQKLLLAKSKASS